MILLNNVLEKEIVFLDKKDYSNTDDDALNNSMRAAEAHRRIRYNLQNLIKVGTSVKEIVDYVEKSTRIMLNGELNNGIGFPCGVSINNMAAHFTPNPWDNNDIILQKNDVLSIDFGTHSDGRIIDSAFTIAFDEKYLNILKASHDATTTAVKAVGIDMRINELGKIINEVISSYEYVDHNNKIIQLKPIYNLCGHTIGKYKIHNGITIPPYDDKAKYRMPSGFCAIETFVTTGKGYAVEEGEASHYMLSNTKSVWDFHKPKHGKIYKIIKKEFSKLPFSPKHLMYYLPNIDKTTIGLLTAKKLIEPHPPLVDYPVKCKTAQFEHTVYLSEDKKVVLSKGEDF